MSRTISGAIIRACVWIIVMTVVLKIQGTHADIFALTASGQKVRKRGMVRLAHIVVPGVPHHVT